MTAKKTAQKTAPDGEISAVVVSYHEDLVEGKKQCYKPGAFVTLAQEVYQKRLAANLVAPADGGDDTAAEE